MITIAKDNKYYTSVLQFKGKYQQLQTKTITTYSFTSIFLLPVFGECVTN